MCNFPFNFFLVFCIFLYCLTGQSSFNLLHVILKLNSAYVVSLNDCGLKADLVFNEEHGQIESNLVKIHFDMFVQLHVPRGQRSANIPASVCQDPAERSVSKN